MYVNTMYLCIYVNFICLCMYVSDHFSYTDFFFSTEMSTADLVYKARDSYSALL